MNLRDPTRTASPSRSSPRRLEGGRPAGGSPQSHSRTAPDPLYDDGACGSGLFHVEQLDPTMGSPNVSTFHVEHPLVMPHLDEHPR